MLAVNPVVSRYIRHSLVPRPIPSFSMLYVKKRERATLKHWEWAWGRGYLCCIQCILAGEDLHISHAWHAVNTEPHRTRLTSLTYANH